MSTTFFSKLGLDQSGHPTDPQWLAELRSEAVSRLLDEGLPTSKTEAWRFTGLRSLLNVPFSVTKKSTAAQEQDSLQWAREYLGTGAETARVYLVNGRPVAQSEALSDYEISNLSQLLSDKPETIEPYLARYAHSEYFGALNSALFSDGLCVRVPANSRPSKALEIVHISDPTGDAPTSCYPRLVIVAGVASECSVIETYLSRPGADELCTAVTEVSLEDGAILDHLRVVEGSETSTHLGTVAVHQERDSRYTSRSVSIGGKLSRVEIDARMSGPGAECNLDGVYHAVGNEHVAHHTLITHDDSNCSSNEEYRGLIDDRAHAVFDGIIVVKQGTKNTSAHQQNHNLLLSDAATINTKPHLEIDSDDLSASHGATIGSLDPAQLFFLRARGIGEDEARSILTLSFVRSILDRINDPATRTRLVAKVLGRLPYGEEMAELAL